jgi:hypothetical protein
VWGGYNKTPLQAAYFYEHKKPFFGQTGKFHSMWGEFGGYKSAKALKIEAAQMLTYGAGMNIGDQLHPSGKLDDGTYGIIKEVFEYYQGLQKYCVDKTPTARLGIMPSYWRPNDEGIVNILIENQLDFRVVLPDSVIQDVDCLILPYGIEYTESRAKELKKYLDAGGKLMLLGDSMLNKQTNTFGVDLGVRFCGYSQYDCDYIRPNIDGLLVKNPIIMYESGTNVTCTTGTSLGEIFEPYFSRTHKKWCSHMHTPNRTEPSDFVCGSIYNNIVYLPHNIGKLYHSKGLQLHSDWFMLALRKIYNEELVRVRLGLNGRIHLVRDDREKYYTLNMMYFAPVKRGSCEVVGDILSLTDKEVKINCKDRVKRVYSVQQAKEIKFSQNGNQLRFVCDIPDAHNTIVIDYK